MKSLNTFHKSRIRLFAGLLIFGILLAGVVVATLNIQQVRTLFIGATGEEAHIQIDARAVLGTMPRPWRNLSQGGEEAGWRIAPISAKVKALNPEYIRIDHLYDFYVGVGHENGKLTFDWTKGDAIVSDILATGAKPYLALSYTPAALAPNGDITGLPTNWGEYQQVVQQTITHFSKSRGIEGMMYEVWNEPDLFGGWKIGGSKNYLTLYGAAARGAQQAAANGAKAFQIGGPATTGLYQNWLDSLLTYAEQNDLRLDFLSWHDYNRNVDQYKKDISQVEDTIAQHPRFYNIEYQITEWGHDPKNDKGYDGNYAAAHTVAVSTELIGVIKRAFVFEIQDGKDPNGAAFWGRWGLITHNNVGAKTKPRYSALKLLDKIGNQRLQLLGRGSWVKGAAALDGTDVTVVLANYDSSGRHSETVPVTITHMENPNYLVDLQYLDGTHKSTNVASTDGVVTTEVPMLANSVVFMRITPQ